MKRNQSVRRQYWNNADDKNSVSFPYPCYLIAKARLYFKMADNTFCYVMKKKCFDFILFCFGEGNKFSSSFSERKKEDLFFDVIQNVIATFNPFAAVVIAHNVQDLRQRPKFGKTVPREEWDTGKPNSGNIKFRKNKVLVKKSLAGEAPWSSRGLTVLGRGFESWRRRNTRWQK